MCFFLSLSFSICLRTTTIGSEFCINLSEVKCSKISNNNCLLKGPRQAVQAQIRLPLKKQSDQGLPRPCLLFGLAFSEFHP